MGRKNFMFLGSDSGSERAATVYWLMVNAKLNGIHPKAYLHHILIHIAEHQVNRIADLPSWNIAHQLRRKAGSIIRTIAIPMSMTVLASRL